MKRPILLSLIALSLFLSPAANAQTATCQDVTVQLDNTGAFSFTTPLTPQTDAEQPLAGGASTNTNFLQSFTAVESGLLHSVSLQFGSPYTVSTTATVNIYDGPSSASPLLGQLVINSPTSFNSGSLVEFVMDDPIEVTAGNVYSFWFDGVGDVFSLIKNDTDPYPGGQSSLGAGTDLLFSTKVLQRPAIDDGSTSAVGLKQFSLSQSVFDCSELGANTVTLTATDNDNNTATCNATVTVEDTEDPVATCQDIAVSLDASGNATITENDIDDGSSDNCAVNLSLDITAFDCGDVGANTVELTVEDDAGNSDNCSATVTVNDDTPPTALCQDVTLQLDGTGSASLFPADVNNGSSDNCAIATTALDQNSFNCSDIGTTTVTLTVTDVNTNVSTCTATITVEDVENPMITCPSDMVVCSADNSGEVVNYTAPVGSDNCSFTTNQTDGSGLTAGSTFPIGTTTQEWTVVDGSSNAANCSFTITVDATPIADFSTTPTCAGEATSFTDESTIDPSSSIVSWTWDMGDGSGPLTSVNPIHLYADTGAYEVSLTVVSAEGCSSTFSDTAYVTSVPEADFSFTNACEGQTTQFTNGSSIDAGTMTYEWDFGDGNTSTDTDPGHVYTDDGTYTVTLTTTSDNGCEDVKVRSVQVFESATALFTASTECEGTATVFTNLSSGNIASQEWDFGDGNTSIDASPTHTYPTANTYNVTLTVTTTNGCESSFTANVTVNALPNVDFTFSDACEGTTVNFVNNSDAGTTNWSLGDGASSTLNNVNHVYDDFGTYDVTLTVTTAQGCVSSLTQQIEIFDLPDFTLDITDVSCYGEATGTIVAVAQGTPAPPWSLSINSGTPQASVTFNDLEAGMYDITAVDANSCEFTVSGEVEEPADTLGIQLLSVNDVLCNGDDSGTIDLQGTGGTGPYTYAVNAGTPQSSGSFVGLAAGNAAVQIQDANMCVFDTTIIIGEPDELILQSTSATDLLCNGDNSGSISVSATGGVTDYAYNLNGSGYDVPNTFNDLAAGTYIMGVLDANGCTDTVHVTLDEPGVLLLSLLDSEDELCFNASDGSIEVGAASGTPPYQYSLDGNGLQGSGSFSGLTADTYSVTVVDANGCTDELTETIFGPTELTIETNSTPVACFGDSTGSIQITADGGTGAYEFGLGDGNFFPNGGSFTDLEGGNYLAVVRDENGCNASEGVNLSEPDAPFDVLAIVSDAACLGDASGVVELLGNGGTATYTFSDDNQVFVPGNVFEGFAAGSYTLYAQDLNGCSDSVTVSVGEPSTAVNINNVLTADPACPNEPSGTITVLAGGGTPGYTYSSDNGQTFQSSQILSGIGGGNHIVAVMDANGCMDTTIVTLNAPPIINISVDSIVGVACEGDLNGEIHLSTSGGTPSYTYMLNGGNTQTDGSYENLTPGPYTITVMDVNGCARSQEVVIPADQLLPVADFDFVVSGDAVLFENLSSSANDYDWDFGDDSTSTDFSPTHVYQQPGDYTVTLTSSNECGSDELTVSVSTVNTSISDSEQLKVTLFPNPSTGTIYLQLPIAGGTIEAELVSLVGHVIVREQLNTTGTQAVLNFSDIAQGSYLLRLSDGRSQTVKRIEIIK